MSNESQAADPQPEPQVTILVRHTGRSWWKAVRLNGRGRHEYVLEPGRKYSLCRCGVTRKPFCDGKHSRIGFAAAERACARRRRRAISRAPDGPSA